MRRNSCLSRPSAFPCPNTTCRSRVEDPPSIAVGKGAYPSTLEAPGGLVNYALTVINTSPSITDPVIVTSFEDDIYGDVTGLVNCAMPFTLAPSQSRTCTFSAPVTGVPGDVITDVITVSAEDDEGEVVQASDTASVSTH